jgi:hypothetical protein
VEDAANTFELTREQKDTADTLEHLLGKAIANRYIDFCRLCSGAFALTVSRPLASHALRELDSLLRHVLETPLEAKAAADPTEREKLNYSGNIRQQTTDGQGS